MFFRQVSDRIQMPDWLSQTFAVCSVTAAHAEREKERERERQGKKERERKRERDLLQT